MVKIRKIRCSDKTEWKRGKDKKDFLVCENPKFAKVAAIMVSKLKTWHDEIMFIEPSLNVIVVPVYQSKEIYLHKEYRPKVMKPGTEIKPYDFDSLKLKSLGMWSFEVPRGGFDLKDKDPKNAAIREVEEETTIKLKSEDLLEIGKINPNTAYVVSNIPVYIAQCKDNQVTKRLSKEEKEKIKTGYWYTIGKIKNMIKDKKIFCAVTLAALNLVLQELELKK